jgi:hypothetical protein
VRFTRLAGLTTAGILALAVAAPATAADDAMVRVIHGSPDAPAVDVYADGTAIVEGLAFGEITDYLAVPGATYAIRVCAAGSDGTDDANCPIIADLTFEAGTKYTVAASDLVAQIKADVFEDGNATAGAARVRVVHLSADTPAVDVRPDGGEPVVENLAYRDATGYLELPGGEYDLEVCATGTDTCPLDLDPLEVANGTAYSVFAVGQLEPTGDQQALTAVVAADGMASPATDTVGASDESAPATGLYALILAAAAALGIASFARLAGARARTRR